MFTGDPADSGIPEKVPLPHVQDNGSSLGHLASRKLFGAMAAMAAVVALILGLAAIQSSLFQSANEIVLISVTGILGLGGWQVMQQAKVDTNGK